MLLLGLNAEANVPFKAWSFGARAPAGARAPIDGYGDALGLSPFWDWKTIETRHFRITFPKELEFAAQKSANYLEEAHALLSPRLYWKPFWRTQVLVIDNADMANGLTSAQGRFGMVFYVTPPESWFSTAYYDNWLKLLAIHEYTHFLNMDITTRFWAPLRYVFGDVLLPNSLWPGWMLEGLAVDMETELTQAGRGRSTYYEMILRSAVEQGVLDNPDYITLDKVNGPNPYPPFGETAYLFGYELMNQVALNPNLKVTSDKDVWVTSDRRMSLTGQDNVLGHMSVRSSGRVPYFINGNLENITGKDWYGYWDEWVKSTRERQNVALTAIKSQPVTPLENLVGPRKHGQDVLGVAASPDGNWIAYSEESPDEPRMGLFLRNARTGDTRRIADKIFGVGMAFTPDSQSLVYSRITRQGIYYLWSDLAVYDLAENREASLTDGMRAKDPDVSRDGKWVTFTLSDQATTGLALAPLVLKAESGEDIRLGQIRQLYTPAKLDRVANPKFTQDGNHIVFSLHRNGKLGDDLMICEVSSGKVKALVADGRLNRFPAVAPGGAVHFVSDRSGVDNVYRFALGGEAGWADFSPSDVQVEQVTNVTSGIWLPAFGPQPPGSGVAPLYASVYSPKGWGLARVQLADHPVATQRVTVSPPPVAKKFVGPPVTSAAEAKPETQYPVKDYSIFPSIYPRAWFPILLAGSDGGVYFGAGAAGADAVDRHRYLVSAAYDTTLARPDLLGIYTNRSLGPSVTLAASESTTNVTRLSNGVFLYDRDLEFSTSILFPITWTYSALFPIFGANVERSSSYRGDYSLGTFRSVPSVDGILAFSNASQSGLGVSTEQGRFSEIGARYYVDPDVPNWKLIAMDTEHFRVTDHSVLVPSIKASYVTRTNRYFGDANVIVEGKRNRLFDALPGSGFSQLGLRGYPLRTFYSKAAAVGALDYRFPLARIFRGWGTNPVFLEQLYGFGFVESAYFPNEEPGVKALPSAGGGVELGMDVFLHIPLILSVEYHQGFERAQGGTGEAFLQLGLGAFSF